MVRAISSVMLLAIVSCSSGGQGVDAGLPDAGVPGDGGTAGPDGGSDDSDGPPGTAGLSFQLVAMPALPEVAATVSIDEVRVWLRDVRAIGDAAPGDSRTSLAATDLDFRTDRTPDPIAFPLAPPGIYSRLDMRLGQGGSGDNGYQLRGHVTVGAQTYELEVEDTQATASISVALGGISVEGATTVDIAIDLAFLGGIDWSTATPDGDKITLGSDDATTAAIRAGMAGAFVLAQ